MKTVTKKNQIVIAGILVSIMTGFMHVAISQELEEVVVTAQRRVQSVMDVPISLEVTSGDDLLREGFRNIEQLASYSPTLDIDGSIHGQSIRVRGIGTEGNNLAVEESVPIFLDRNHVGRGEMIYGAFLDVDRVEVLRGPQPVYFGQNASAGAISITSRKPTAELEGYVAGETGNNSQQMVEFGIGGPITETLGVRVAGKYDKGAGFAIDQLSDEKYPAYKNKAGRITLEWRPSEEFRATAVAGASDVTDQGRAVSPIAHINGDDTGYSAIESLLGVEVNDEINNIGIRGGPLYITPPLSLRRGFTSTNQRLVDLSGMANSRDASLPFQLAQQSEVQPWNTYLELEYELANGIILNSQTAYSDLWVDYVRDTRPQGPFVLNTISRKIDEKQFNQELRISSASGGFLEWSTGVYYQKNSRDEFADNINPDFTGNLSNVRKTIADENGRWMSAFVNLTFNVNDFGVDMGGRYTDVKKDARHNSWMARYIVSGGGFATNHGDTAIGLGPYEPLPGSNDAEFTDSMLNPQIVLRYSPSEDLNIYAKYANAFKSGGFDTSVIAVVAPVDFILASEFGENWELGMKGRFFDGRVSAEAIGFWTTFEDLQVSSFDEALGRQRTINVASQRVRGVELNSSWAATDRLTLGISGTIQQGKMLEYPGALCTRVDVDSGRCGVGGIPGRIDRTGEEPLRTPTYYFNTKVNYEHPVMDEQYKINFSGMFRYSDGFLRDYDKIIVADTTFNANLTLGFGTADDKWTLSVYGRNLTNPTPTYDASANGSIRALELELLQNMFRTYGVQFKYNIF